MSTFAATISAGQSLSNEVNVTGTLQAIAIPPNLTPALLTFQISPDNGTTWFDVMTTDNVELAYNMTPGTIFSLPTGTVLDNKTWIKVRTGSRVNPVPQQNDVAFQIMTA